MVAAADQQVDPVLGDGEGPRCDGAGLCVAATDAGVEYSWPDLAGEEVGGVAGVGQVSCTGPLQRGQGDDSQPVVGGLESGEGGVGFEIEEVSVGYRDGATRAVRVLATPDQNVEEVGGRGYRLGCQMTNAAV
ncbi:hypothetical protein ACPW96_20380 [Micromonospora sp. DT81.3]|uniref:hypothetical protein n=1 Tax=Micromonospora sp. DT81.3 TaxID=3416523 RepID=UPI003CF80F4A